jgi:hypothetical protein
VTKGIICTIGKCSYINTVEKYYIYGERLKNQINDQNTMAQNDIFNSSTEYSTLAQQADMPP